MTQAWLAAGASVWFSLTRLHTGLNADVHPGGQLDVCWARRHPSMLDGSSSEAAGVTGLRRHVLRSPTLERSLPAHCLGRPRRTASRQQGAAVVDVHACGSWFAKGAVRAWGDRRHGQLSWASMLHCATPPTPRMHPMSGSRAPHYGRAPGPRRGACSSDAGASSQVLAPASAAEARVPTVLHVRSGCHMMPGSSQPALNG